MTSHWDQYTSGAELDRVYDAQADELRGGKWYAAATPVAVSAREKRVLAREGEHEGVDVARTRGSYVYDTRGKRYIDFLAGWCVGNFGWSRRATTARIRRYAGPDYVYPGYSYKGWVGLAELLRASRRENSTDASAQLVGPRRWTWLCRPRCSTPGAPASCRSKTVITATRSPA